MVHKNYNCTFCDFTAADWCLMCSKLCFQFLPSTLSIARSQNILLPLEAVKYKKFYLLNDLSQLAMITLMVSII